MSPLAHDPEKLKRFPGKIMRRFNVPKASFARPEGRAALQDWQHAYFGIFLPISGNIVSAVMRIWSE